MDVDVDPQYQNLIGDCLIQIFKFLPVTDLISACSVCKDWNVAAESPWLWRRLSLQRWTFCNLTVLGGSEHEGKSWKRYYLRRVHVELNMTKGQAGGYTCKSLRGHTGRVVGLVYLQGNSVQHPDLWHGGATVCSASTDGTVRAWNAQNGELLWCTPVQSPLTRILSDEKHEAVITADSTGLIKTWHGQTGQELASFSAASSHCALVQYNINNDWFLMVGTTLGSLCTLAGSTLTKKSSLVVCEGFRVNILLVSPDKKWIIAGTTKDYDDLSSKVIFTESLTSPSEDEDPLCQSLPVNGSQAAVFMPTHPARLAILHQGHFSDYNTLTVFDVSIKKTKYITDIQVQQVESFCLSLNRGSSDILLEAQGSNLVVASNQVLWVYSLKGDKLVHFSEHTMPISSICVDMFRVVTASRDLSLRVLTWKKDRDHGLTLESSGFTHVACDYSSIVASVEGKDGKDVLKAYSFTS